MRTKLIFLIYLMFFFAGCKSAKDVSETTPKNGNQITETYWKLKSLKGQDVEMADNQERERYFILKKKDNRIRGFAGCNTFSGTYSLDKENQIHFWQMASTMKACPDVDLDESKFLDIFKNAEHYTIHGDVMELRKGRGNPLAIFESVYFN